MPDDTTSDTAQIVEAPPAFVPATIPDGALFEVHEYIPGRFVWHIFEADGETLVDWWNRGQYAADDPTTGEYTLYAGDGRKITESMFRTERAAYDYCWAAGAKCKTVFTGGHADPEIAKLIAAQG